MADKQVYDRSLVELATGANYPLLLHDNGDGTYSLVSYSGGSAALPAGNNNIGDVDVASIAAGETHIGAVGGNTSRVELLFKTSGGDVAIPSTPSAYTVGNVIGTNFTLANLGRIVGGTGILYNAALLEILGASAYNGQAVTATSASPAVFTLNAHTLVNGNRVKLGGTAVPTGFTAGTSYYVVSAAANTFQLSLTPGGAAVNSSSTGTAVTVTEVPAQVPCTLWLTSVAPTAATDNTVPAPTAADFETFKDPIQFSSYSQIGLHAISPASIQRAFKCGAATRDFYGYLLFNGTANQTFSKQAYLKLRIFALQD